MAGRPLIEAADTAASGAISKHIARLHAKGATLNEIAHSLTTKFGLPTVDPSTVSRYLARHRVNGAA